MDINSFPENQAVFTTKSIVNKQTPITYFTLDKDGDFQAFGDEDVDPGNAMLVSLKQVFELENTLRTIGIINAGDAFIREGHGGKWELLVN